MNFNRLNNITGWVVFLLTTCVYILTLEPTGSFWDCGEFISTSYKLMIPHPPGAPLFLLIGRFFSLFASDVTQVAYWVNMVSALSSSFTVLFLFWTITMLAMKLVKSDENGNYTLAQQILIIGAGMVGSLSFAFSDSFWFSSEEAEVYAMSSFFTAIVFWAILKWERRFGKENADRWIILIAYLVGLSIGVHLLNLVILPAIAFVYYFKKYEVNIKGIIITSIASVIGIFLVMNVVITGLPTMASKLEVMFVNSLKLPFGSGLIAFVVLLLGALIFGIYYTHKKGKEMWNTGLISFAFILIGYSMYGVIAIRSQYNPPIDMNNPENIMSMVSYLKREQYGDRPLLRGPVYTAGYPVDSKKQEAMYRRVGDKYEVYDYKMDYIYDKKHMMLLPRLYSTQPHHIEEYKRICNIKGDKKPTFGDNLEYMFVQQFGFFWGRYFMWNFAGRAGSDYGSDYMRPTEWFASDVPELISKDKARNNFFMIPFALGLLGFVYHFLKNVKDATVVTLFFLFTGLVLVFYLNPPPIEPRERDYTYVGSYYAFAIWIGFGVLFIDELLRFMKNNMLTAGLAILISLSGPYLMAKNGWDDHDRSKRFHSVDSAKNLLNSCEKNAILFTGGDNDTYPLWYAQEVEGYRTDVRVCNLSLLNTDWYIGQMTRKAYDSEPLPIKLPEERYLSGTNDVLYFYEDARYKGGISLKGYLNYIRDNRPEVVQMGTNGENLTIYPSKTFIMPIDKEDVLKKKLVVDTLSMFIPDQFIWNITGNHIDKKTLAIMDIIANNNWERPIYFSTTLSTEDYLNLREYMQLEGLAYRLIPMRIQGGKYGWIASEKMYENMMTKFHWRNLQDSTIYYDENFLRFPANARNQFGQLANQMIAEKKMDKARNAILRSLEVMPDHTVPYDYYMPSYISILYKIGEKAKADEIANTLGNRAIQTLDYLKRTGVQSGSRDFQMNLAYLDQIVNEYKEVGEPQKASKFYEKLYFYFDNK